MNGAWKLRIAVILLSLCARLPAQEAAAVPYYVDWDAVPGAGGYRVEVRDIAGEVAFTADVEEHEITLSLTPGSYSLRITTLDRMGRADNATEWIFIDVLARTPPVFRGAKPRTLTADAPISIAISADNMSESSTAYLTAPGKRRINLSVKPDGKNRFILSGRTFAETGSYTLVLANSDALTAKASGDFTIRFPDAVIEDISPQKLRQVTERTEIVITGRRFSPDIRFSYAPLESGTVEAEARDTDGANGPNSPDAPPDPLAIEHASKSSVTCRFTKEVPPGVYRLFCANNRADTPTTRLVFIVEKPPETAVAQQPPEKAPSPATASNNTVPTTPAVATQPQQQPQQQAQPQSATTPAPPTDRTTTDGDIPRPANKNRLALAIGGSIDLRNDAWAITYSGPNYSGFIAPSVYLLGDPLPKTGISLAFSLGLRADVQLLEQTNPKYVNSRILNVVANLLPGLTFALPFGRIQYYAGGGLCYTYLEYTPPDSTTVTARSSLDPTAAGGLTIECPIFETLTLGASGHAVYMFMTTPSLVTSLSLFASAMLPFKR
jgi:hypothetical protein